MLHVATPMVSVRGPNHNDNSLVPGLKSPRPEEPEFFSCSINYYSQNTSNLNDLKVRLDQGLHSIFLTIYEQPKCPQHKYSIILYQDAKYAVSFQVYFSL